jgi:hypothetical protein
MTEILQHLPVDFQFAETSTGKIYNGNRRPADNVRRRYEREMPFAVAEYSG